MGEEDDMPTTLSRLLLRHGMAVRRRHTERARRIGLDDRSALAVAHVVSAGALTPWQLARRLSLTSEEAFLLVDALTRAGYLTRGAGGRRGFVLHPTRLALATFGPTADACEELDDGTRTLLGRFIASAAEAAEREADRLLAESPPAAERSRG